MKEEMPADAYPGLKTAENTGESAATRCPLGVQGREGPGRVSYSPQTVLGATTIHRKRCLNEVALELLRHAEKNAPRRRTQSRRR